MAPVPVLAFKACAGVLRQRAGRKFNASSEAMGAAACCLHEVCMCDSSGSRACSSRCGGSLDRASKLTAARVLALHRPTPSEQLYGAGSAEDLARSYGGGDSLTAANLVTSAAQVAAAQQDLAASRGSVASPQPPGAPRDSGGGRSSGRGRVNGELNSSGGRNSSGSRSSVFGLRGPDKVAASTRWPPPPPVATRQTFQHAPPRSSGGAYSSGSSSPSSRAAVRSLSFVT